MRLRLDLQRLSKNGSSTAVTITRPVMRHLGWLPGQTVIVEVNDDDSIRIRRPTAEDLGPQVTKRRSIPIAIEQPDIASRHRWTADSLELALADETVK